MPDTLAPMKLGRDAAGRSIAVARGAAAVAGSFAAKGIGWTARRLRARPTSTIAGAAFAALMVGIGLNALVLQKARHPAPLFEAPAQDNAQAPAAPPATAAPEKAAAAQPPAPADSLDRAPTGTLPSANEAAAPAAEQPAEVAQPAPAAAPAPSAAVDDAPVAKPKKKRHARAAAKKGGGHDKISQYLAESKPHRRHKARNDD